MLDQSFSADNFRKIIDIENRKGIYLEGEFYEDIYELNARIKNINAEIRNLKFKQCSREEYLKDREYYNARKETYKKQKEEILKKKLHAISLKVTSSDFKIKVEKDEGRLDKTVYKVGRSLENILALKQLQYNFRKLYKVKQANRYSIISQLKLLLDDGFPKVIVRTDIKNFYESIPQEKLLRKINNDNLLTHLSLRFIQQLLNTYRNLAESDQGIPRGIGISPYLAELYLREIDASLRSLPAVMYYARYVDDIVIVFMPQVKEVPRNYVQEVSAVLASEGLHMNEGKTREINLLDFNKDVTYSFDYLGYNFSSGYKSRNHVPLRLSISRAKRKRYAFRLMRALELYKVQAKGDEKKARKLLVRRVRFLTSNTRLINNKRHVVTGVYYTNSLVNCTKDFIILDRFLSLSIRKAKLPEPLRARLGDNSFSEGFNPTKLCKFRATDLKEMIKSWKK